MAVCSVSAAPLGGVAFFLQSGNPFRDKTGINQPKSQSARFLSFVCAAIFGLASVSTNAVASRIMDKEESITQTFNYEAEEDTNQTESKENALEEISGSRFPGCIDHLLARPLEMVGVETPTIHINYPSTGNRFIDGDIREWVTNLADSFTEHLEVPHFEETEQTADLDLDRFLHDDDLNAPIKDNQNSIELWGDYSITFPSENALSITFEIWNYAGNDQHNLDILTLNYNKLNGQRLGLVDIFDNPDLALHLMSDFSRKQLEKRLGAALRPKTLLTGTEPLPENFASLTLVKDAIQINFQPWQVASGDTGAQKVVMPLTELLAAGPLLALWNK